MRKISYLIIIITASFIIICGCHASQTEQSDAQASGKTPNVPSSPSFPDNDIQETVPIFMDNYIAMGTPEIEDQKRIRELFHTFQQAVLKYHGSEAAALLSSSSLEYYDNLLKGCRLSLHDAAMFSHFEPRLTPGMRATIRIMNARLTPEYIDSASPISLYTTAINQGWIGYHTLSTSSIDNLTLYTKDNKKYILAAFYYKKTFEEKAPIRIGFQYENGTWKVDLVPIFASIDSAIDDMIDRKHLNSETALNDTIKESEDRYNNDTWIPYINKEEGFGVYFPKEPVIEKGSVQNVYTASHRRFGQFGIQTSQSSIEDGMAMIEDKSYRNRIILSFFTPLEAQDKSCTSSSEENAFTVQCDFTLPSRHSRGKAVWVFLPQQQFLLFNIAHTSGYSEEAAAKFIQSFAYNKK